MFCYRYDDGYYLYTSIVNESLIVPTVFSSYTYLLPFQPIVDLWMHVRYLSGDDTLLNPCYGWGHCLGFELAVVAETMDSPLPSWQQWMVYFAPFEEYLQSLGGRPHWAKFHNAQPHHVHDLKL